MLIALAVIVLPMLLGGRPDNPQETQSIEVPPKPSELSFETRRFPVAGQDPDQPSVVEQPVETQQDPVDLNPDTDQAQVTSPPARSETTTPVRQKPAPQTNNPPAQQPAELPSTSGRYLVQVGSFSTAANANALAERLRVDGLPVLMDTVDSAVGTLHRVRVGPFDKAAEADAAAGRIRERTPDVSPRIIDLRPDEPAPVTEPSDPLVRWVVQAGSFSGQENATALVMQLREAGFAAYSVTQKDGSGISYKVRVGPEIERQSAVDSARKLKEQLGLDGIVMSVD